MPGQTPAGAGRDRDWRLSQRKEHAKGSTAFRLGPWWSGDAKPAGYFQAAQSGRWTISFHYATAGKVLVFEIHRVAVVVESSSSQPTTRRRAKLDHRKDGR